MARPKNITFNLKERISRLKAAGFNFYDSEAGREVSVEEQNLLLKPLSDRISLILRIIQNRPIKATAMNYLILYDIEKDKVRNLIAKYLISKGCIRIQKSVFLAHTENKMFDEIRQTLAEINEIYHNHDSIILVPLNVSDARSMKLIGQNVNINQIIDPPGTVFI
ncbi:MAG: CRISPR-associated endonuclease Cas2 [Chitinophagaceae bacterium]|nr:CRISPR-associated endonuclease Cas2 [Chitinophagaceae bacterium]